MPGLRKAPRLLVAAQRRARARADPPIHAARVVAQRLEPGLDRAHLVRRQAKRGLGRGKTA